jgi:hypothetical protein
MMDLGHAWALMGWTQKACTFFVVVASVLTVARSLRLTLWALHPADGAAAANRWHKASRWVRSTRGLAQTALYFTGAAAAAGLDSAFTVAASSRSMILYVIEDGLHVADSTAIVLLLCALLGGTALVFELVVRRCRRPWSGTAFDASVSRLPACERIDATMRCARRALEAISVVLIAAALIELRPGIAGPDETNGDGLLPFATFVALHELWQRLTPIAAALGLITWLGVLAPSLVSAGSRSAVRVRRR